MLRRIFSSALLIALFSLPAIAQPPADSAIHPTRFFDRLNGTPGYIRLPGVEESTTLAPGTFVLDTALTPGFGFNYGLLPNLEVGADVVGSTQFNVDSGIYKGQELTTIGVGIQGKYHMLTNGPWKMAVLGELGYGYIQYAVQELGVEYGNNWLGYLGLPISYYCEDQYSLHAMPIVEVGKSGGLNNPPGVCLGAKIRIRPSLWALIGDYMGLGSTFSQILSAGLRYEPGNWGSFDIKLVDYNSNTSSPAWRIGSFGVTGYFGGSR